MDVSVIIPSRTDTYLQKTIDDLLVKARGSIEVVVVLDSYWPKTFNWTDNRLVIVHRGSPGQNLGLRNGINSGIAVSRGKYVMKCDEHCMFDEGFDVKLLANIRNNWVVVPRRYRLDAEKWEIIQDGRPPVDYMRLQVDEGYLHGVEWKRPERSAPEFDIDNTPTMQGSCWLMSRAFWEQIGPMDEENYGQFANEAQEISLKSWLIGGRVIVNKKTWYAHWHRTTGYNFTPEQQLAFKESVSRGREYSFKHWTDHPGFEKFMRRFA